MTNYQYPARQAVRQPLTAGQHILHLLLTLVTCGLWIPVWIWRAISGNMVWADTLPGYRPPPPYGWQPGPWSQPPPTTTTVFPQGTFKPGDEIRLHAEGTWPAPPEGYR